MTFYIPTSSKVKVMIHGIDLDLAFRLDWKEAQPRVPIYGYNDHEYTKTIAGRKLIQGFLVMNYIAPHYLTSYFTAQETEARNKAEQDKRRELFEILPPTLTEEDRKARAEMLSSLLFKEHFNLNKQRGTNYGPGAAIGVRADVAATQARHFANVAHGGAYLPSMGVGLEKDYPGIKKQLFDSFGDTSPRRTLTLNNREPNIDTIFDISRPFDMEVYHLEPEFAPWYIVLKDVEITDVSQTMSAAGADGSSDPLYETYEFIAKRRTIVKTRR